MRFLQTLSWAAGVLGFPVAALAASILAGDEYRPIVLSVRVNGITAAGMAETGIILREQNGHLFARRSDLALLHLRLPKKDSLEKDGTSYVALDAMPSLSYKVVEETQVLEITAAAPAFAEFAQTGTNRTDQTKLNSTGTFLNYDLDAEWIGKARINGLVEAGTFGVWGVLTSTFERSGYSGLRVQRLQTSLLHDFPSRRESLRLGDSVTNPGAWGLGVNFAGIQWGTDFSTQPDFVTFPVPSIRGDAVAPSTAELYVNGALRQVSQVGPGPFELIDPPLVSGPGQITLVVRDALGRETITTSSYFASSELLAAGLNDYSVQGGWLRRSSLFGGPPGNGYANLFGTAMFRRGLTRRITGEVRAEIVGGLRTAGVTGTAQVVGGLVVSAGIVASDNSGLLGNLGLSSVEWQTRVFSVGVDGERASDGFRQLGIENGLLPTRRRLGAFVGVSPFGRDHLTASYFEQDGPVQTSVANAGYSSSLGAHTFVSATVARILSGKPESIFTMALTYQIDDRTSVTPSYSGGQGGEDGQVQVRRNLPLGPGTGYDLIAGNEHQEGELDVRNRTGTYELDAARVNGTSAYRADMQGALATVGRKLMQTRSIDDAFAVVRVGHFSGVHVLADNQAVGVTDSNGEAVVPRLLSFQANRISIDPSDLPMSASLGALEIVVRPGRRMGVRVEFPVTDANGVLAFLTDSGGTPIPPGAIARIDGSDATFPVALHGAVYLSGLTPGPMTLRVTWTEGTCFAKLQLSTEDLEVGSETRAVCSRKP